MVNTNELRQHFSNVFTSAEATFAVRAPGRVNLIGEHTDYNDGFVLPIAMTHALEVIGGPADDGQVAVHSTAFAESITFSARKPGPPQEGRGWGNYVRGVAAMLGRQGVPLRGGRLVIHSQVPIGGGVSSSAALECGTALALLTLAGQSMDPIPLALLARQAEHEYAKSPCGIMDQFICMLGRAGQALLLDCRSQAFEHVPLPDHDTVLMVMDTQVKHSIGGSEYPVRQQQCQTGLAHLRAIYPEITALRDVTPEQIRREETRLDGLVFRRCRHVITEIERTLVAAGALRGGDLVQFGRLMFESHASLRDDYEVSCPELDALVEVARGVPGVYGARMTGGGFGGCAIALLRKDAQQALVRAVESQYNPRFEKPALAYPTAASDGAAVQRL